MNFIHICRNQSVASTILKDTLESHQLIHNINVQIIRTYRTDQNSQSLNMSHQKRYKRVK